MKNKENNADINKTFCTETKGCQKLVHKRTEDFGTGITVKFKNCNVSSCQQVNRSVESDSMKTFFLYQNTFTGVKSILFQTIV